MKTIDESHGTAGGAARPHAGAQIERIDCPEVPTGFRRKNGSDVYFETSPKMRAAAAGALQELSRLRSTGCLVREILEAEVERIARENLRPCDCDLIVRRTGDGLTRFFIRAEATGRTCDLITHFFHHDETGTGPAQTGSLVPVSRLVNGSNPLRRGVAMIAFLLAVAAGFGFSGCVASGTANAKQAIVCPECKMVGVPIDEPYYVGVRPSWFGRGSSAVVYKDLCPNCHGSLETFAREGQWKHKCSICKESPFSCPVVHPRPSKLVASASPQS